MAFWNLIFVSPTGDRVAVFKQASSGRSSRDAELAAAKVVENHPHLAEWRLAAAATECRDLCVMVGSPQSDQHKLIELM